MMIQLDDEPNEQKPKFRVTVVKVLVALNVLLWGMGAFLWLRTPDLPPVRAEDFVMAREISTPIRADFSDSRLDFALRLIDTDLEIASRNALLLNLDTGEILFNHNGEQRVYPASVTKIMTVLLGIKYGESGDMIDIHADFEALMNSGAALAGFVDGETRTFSEVLHGSMLASGADATTSLAYYISGSYEEFVDLMNETATRLGMVNTHFMNASGLHHENHYTTAYDIALLLDYALNYPEFRQIFATATYSFTDFFGQQQEIQSTMQRNMESLFFNGGHILGGKTGYTTPAGLCLASLATDGEHEFALITFGASRDDGENLHISDAFSIYEYFFQPFQP